MCWKVQLRKGRLTQQEQEEGLVVAMANTVVDPGTMMTHAKHASLAHSTMVTSGWLVAFALLTKSQRSPLRHQAFRTKAG